ncbi:SMP-30/gluconolactonase/LRE family protein [Hymenobacter aerilatus]|uniref:SMP-30/gluconolactonase/LRE family protein n=1 Tax=Hymenobacter aerilatus TaxID=2932251 RepID=A0A8T9SZH5_9BACT|nr:SMP-30/gluconolactonase/LRE family protein [Hymenobacter aerilatus]UOR06791.1 SMP-30/gluconolactonase/LRE family protein [Hymenobacter aerilatus]
MKPITLSALLLGGAWLAACQPSTTSTETTAATAADSTSMAAATPAAADSMGVPAGSTPTVGNPQLLFTLPDKYNTPDGLALAPNGNVLLSIPNLADNSQPAAILEVVGNTYRPFITTLPVEPTTQKAAPMDLAFGPDGNLYYAENQYENSKKFVSRLMRVRMQNGKPGAIETAVDSFALANAVVWKGNKLYVTDSQWDLPDNDKGSAVLVFTLDELNKANGPLHLKPKTKDPHVLAMFTTHVNETGVDNGADGLDYDSQGNFYTGSFGDGTFYKMTLKPDGTLVKQEALPLKGNKIRCIDGFVIDRTTDKAYVTDARQNAIFVVNLKDNTVTTLAQNPDTDGAGGKIDQPAEVLLKGKRLYISNYDNPVKHFVNTASDAPHTESYIDLL